jgi:hypothetical protein
MRAHLESTLDVHLFVITVQGVVGHVWIVNRETRLCTNAPDEVDELGWRFQYVGTRLYSETLSRTGMMGSGTTCASQVEYFEWSFG